MKTYTQEEMKNIYAERRLAVAGYLTQNEIGAAVYIDSEEHRDPAIPYLTGHNADAIVIVFSDGYTYLILGMKTLQRKMPFTTNLFHTHVTRTKKLMP